MGKIRSFVKESFCEITVCIGIITFIVLVYLAFFKPTTVLVTIEGKLDLMPLLTAAAKSVLGEEATGLFSGIKAPDAPEIEFEKKEGKKR